MPAPRLSVTASALTLPARGLACSATRVFLRSATVHGAALRNETTEAKSRLAAQAHQRPCAYWHDQITACHECVPLHGQRARLAVIE